MSDLFYFGLALLFFILSIGFVFFSDSLMEE